MGQACVASLSRNGTQCGSRRRPASGERAGGKEPALQGIGSVSLPPAPFSTLSSLAASPRVVDCGVTKGAFQPPSVSLRLTWACGTCFYFPVCFPSPRTCQSSLLLSCIPCRLWFKNSLYYIFSVFFFFLGTRIRCTLFPSAIVTQMYCVCARTCSCTCACVLVCVGSFGWCMRRS